MRINFVITGVGRTRFSAGHLIIFSYANGLADRGHCVRVIPLGPSYRPDWIDVRFELVQYRRRAMGRHLPATAGRLAAFRLGRGDRAAVAGELTEIVRRVAPYASLPFQRAALIDRASQAIPEADVTLATACETAIPVLLYGTGALAYFMQNYEVLFAARASDPRLAEAEARLSYELPLAQIANSTWLRDQVAQRHGTDPLLCLNAVDLDTYFPEGEPPSGPFRVISYSGQGAQWKGFAEAAEAVRLAREELPELEWWVFGGNAALPPDNPVASYVDLGFLNPVELRRRYSKSHVILCSAWFESFAMYPIEAMACGCAVVSTPEGTEDYLRTGENALIVPAREPRAMADAVVRLAEDPALRARVSAAGRTEARRFSWARALDRMEEVLTAIVERNDASRASRHV